MRFHQPSTVSRPFCDCFATDLGRLLRTGALLDKPSIGLEDMDEERAEMDRLIKERSEKSGAVAQMVTKVGRSAMFEILVMLMIVACK